MTPFSQIYKFTMSLLDNNERIQDMDLDLKMDLFSDLIIMTSSADFTDCIKDLDKVTPYTYQSVTEKLLIGMQTIDMDIPKELMDYEGIIVMRNGEQLDNVTTEVDRVNNTVTITWGDPILDDLEFEDEDEVTVVFFKDGYFEETLSSREITILAHGVLLKLIGQEVAKEDRIKENLSDKDYQISGRWQTLNSLMEMQNSFKTEFKEYLKSYTYSVATTYEDLM